MLVFRFANLGFLPSNIGNLIQLSFLNIERNNFYGNFYESIYNFNNYLDIGSIPSNIGSLVQLKGLNIRSNSFSGILSKPNC